MINTVWAKLGLEGRTVASTAGALLSERVVRIVIGFVVTGIVARHLGPTVFGNLSYGLALGAIGAGLAQLGSDSILIREFARHPADSAELIVTSLVLRFGATVIAWILTLALAFATSHGADAPSFAATAVLALTAVQAVIAVPGYWLQTHGRAWQSTLLLLAIFFAAAAARVVSAFEGASLIIFGWIAVAELVFSGAATFIQARRVAAGHWRVSARKAVGLWRASWPLALAAIAYLGYTRFDQVLVGLLAGQDQLGLYAAALRLTEQSYVLPSVLATPMLAMIARQGENPAAMHRRAARYFSLSAVLAYAFVAAVWIAAPWLYRHFFGHSYAAAGSLARIQVWMAPLVAVGLARNQILISEGKTLFALAAALAGFSVNLVLNLLLIPRLGAAGACWAGLAAQAVSLVASTWWLPSLRWAGRLQLIALVAPWRLWAAPKPAR